MKLIGLLDLPGTGAGLLRSRSPQARICVAAMILLAVLIAPVSSPGDLAFILGAAALSLALAGTPVRFVVRILLVYCILYGPMMLLLTVAGWLSDGAMQSSSLAVPPWIAGTALRSFGVLIVSCAGISSLSISDAIGGSSVLPLPRLVVMLLFHILHQAGLMLRETVSVSQAVAMRGGASGIRAGLLMARSLPSVWLPRIQARVDRTARAGELRGAEHIHGYATAPPWRRGDAVFVSIAIVLPVAAFALRFAR